MRRWLLKLIHATPTAITKKPLKKLAYFIMQLARRRSAIADN
jgi:hypothetical protein